MTSYCSFFHVHVRGAPGSHGAGKSSTLHVVCRPAGHFYWQIAQCLIPPALAHGALTVCSQQHGKGWMRLEQTVLLQKSMEAGSTTKVLQNKATMSKHIIIIIIIKVTRQLAAVLQHAQHDIRLQGHDTQCQLCAS